MKTKRIDPLPRNLSPDALLRSLGIVRPEDIDIAAIAFYAGLKIKKRILHSCEAMITGVGNKGIISISPLSLGVRQRFSIAHELGHWHHHRGQSMACRSDEIGGFSKTSPEERAADQYAADLLMPLSMFKTVCRDFAKLDLKSVREIAGVFGCSLTATMIRIIDTGRYPTAMIVCHGRMGRKWYKPAAGIPAWWKPKQELDTESLALTLLNDPVAEDQSFPRKIGADAWFDNWEAERFEITEQSFRVPGDGIVTILVLANGMVR